MIKISASSSNAFRSCLRKGYYYKTRSFTDNLNFIYGRSFENGFEYSLKNGLENGIKEGFRYFKEQKPIRVHAKNLMDKDEFSLSKLRKDIKGCKELLPVMIERLYNFIIENNITFVENQFKTISTMSNDNKLEGRFDGLIEYNGKLYIWELKGYTSFKKIEELEYDNQVLTYLLLNKEKKIGTEGVLFCQVKKSLNVEPKLIKKGKELSTDKSQKCLAEDYLETALGLYGEDDIPVKVMECYEELKKNKLIQMDIIEPKENVIDNFYNEMLSISEQMDELVALIEDDRKEAYKKCYTNRSLGCTMCNFQKECKNNEL